MKSIEILVYFGNGVMEAGLLKLCNLFLGWYSQLCILIVSLDIHCDVLI